MKPHRLVPFVLMTAWLLGACEQNVRYVEATPVPEVSSAPLEGDDQ